MNPAVAAALVAVLGLASLTTSEHIIDRAIHARDVQRRASSTGLGNLHNGTNNNTVLPSVLSDSFVEGCVSYDCFCTKSTKGDVWAEDGCYPKDCKFGQAAGETNDCECVWMGCDCTRTADLMGGKGMRCIECAAGMTLFGDHCYVENNTSMVTAIVLVLGIAMLISLLATCYTLGGMDPGRDSIIYRLTAQRIKSH